MDKNFKRYHIYSSLSKPLNGVAKQFCRIATKLPLSHTRTAFKTTARRPFRCEVRKSRFHTYPRKYHYHFRAASYPFIYLPACYQNHLHVAVCGSNLSTTPWPYIMTSSHIHTTSLRRRFLSPCGWTHRGDGARGHVGS